MKTVIEHAQVVCMDPEKRVLQDGYVVLDGNRIAEVGEGSGPKDIPERVDAQGGILMPGMVNVHSHISMVPFRSMGDDCPDRLRRFLFPLELEAMTPELVYAAARYAVCELLLAGVTSVLDMYYFEDQVAKACEEMGIRAWVGETVINMETCDSRQPYGGLALCEELIRKWKGHHRIHPIVAPHATNTNSPEMLKAAFDLAERYDVGYTLHVSEMDYEMELFRKEYDQTPVQFLHDLGVLDKRTIAAHCIHLTEEDIDLFAAAGAKVAHCVGSNTKGGKGVCPVHDLRRKGVDVGVGTDGPSSGNTLDLFTQFKMISCAQKTRYHSRGLFPSDETVELGTMGGARVLGAEQEIGSIEPGKKADLVLLENRSVNMFPAYNPYSVIVYSAGPRNVDSVWVDGVRLVQGGCLLHTDIRTERERLAAHMGEFVKRAQRYADII
ncbi:MAG TPA: amidohydrolase [Candidatus Ventrimonas merdavium]|nr:amidohydrolase [Candidatus Ventrimonas merdavium]